MTFLSAGTRLGPYEILSPLGAGGMGEVYRARDSRLGREIAVKVLPGELSKDSERLARFEREARAASGLSDPHVVAVFDVGRESGAAFLVTELVEGSDLRNLLLEGRLATERAIEIAAQIAEGLAAAHEKGIVHRDVKPENILVTASGLAKIGDFGLAKTTEGREKPATDDGRTVSSYTEPGTVLGTVGYMSPEQIRGTAVDHRSDIFSLGGVLLEMLTGARPFQRETAPQTMAAILTEEPPAAAGSKAVIPLALDHIVRRCLEKNPEARFQSAKDLAFALRMLSGAREDPASAAKRGVAGVTVRSILPLPSGLRLSGSAPPALTISRDGSKVAFVAQEGDAPAHLYVCHLESGETARIPESEYAEGPFFSPDGRWVAFAADVAARSPRPGELRKHSFSSGLTQTVCPIPGYEGGCWGDDDAIYLVGSVTRGVLKVGPAGGEAQPAVTRFHAGTSEGPRCVGYPRVIDRTRLAFVLDWDASRLGETSLLDLGSGELRSLGGSGSTGIAAAIGHVLYTRIDGTLLAAPFDTARGRASGPAVAVAKDIAQDGAGGVFALSETGTLVFARGNLRGSEHERKRLVRLERGGDARSLPFPEEQISTRPRLSSDGRSLLVSSRFSGISIHDLERGTRARLPSGDTRLVDYPLWAPGEDRIAYRGARVGEMGWKIFRQRSDGCDEPEILWGGDAFEKRPCGFTADGAMLLYEALGDEQERGLWGLPISEGGTPRRLLAGTLAEPSVSPDGRFLAYQSAESGRIEIFAQPLPDGGRRVQISVGGGRLPRWSADGRELFYMAGNRFFAVSVETSEAAPRFGPPRSLFDRAEVEGYEVSPNGGFITVERSTESGIVRELNLVTGWFRELERLAPLPEKK